MRACFARSFHSSRISLAFRKTTTSAEGRASTPKKASGEYRWFEKAAPYSKLGAKAPEVTPDQVPISIGTLEVLESAASGQLITWPSEVQSKLHHIGSFKPTQQNELFKQHVSVVRQESRYLWDKLLAGGKSGLITGDGGVGKTSLLAQAHAAAKLKGWGVVHISRAEKLLDGSSDTLYNTETGVWDQPMFVSRLWKKAIKANRDILGDKTKRSVGSTLLQLVNTLGENNQNVLVTIDNINAISQKVFSNNTNEKNERLYHNDLEVVNTVLKLLQAPPKNITVLGATCGSYKPINWEGYAYAPLTDYDPELVGKLMKAERIELGHFNAAESQMYANYLHAAEVTAKPWQELYQAGNGSPRAMLELATNYAH